ncbi:MAG: arsenite S-adenosylmethyltransferase [Deltaproteobacteria bacterium RBG_13_65_10]|nr:MAG: arsenite S-adenosylmethyltransferase [Deltaproteobacteria bacterium RBG_13_65_10]
METPNEKNPTTLDPEEIRKQVSERYGGIAMQKVSSCCSTEATQRTAKAIGYSDEDLSRVPENANLGLGCGNPLAFAALRPGDVVVDLGSGGGFDTFLAAREVGERGHVIGVDMTDHMIALARANAEKGGFKNVEFRKGTIEDLPVADATADMIISNCVINLSPEKPKVFAEAFRVLKPGGRLMVSDIVLTEPLPEALLSHMALYAACVAGAALREEYLEAIRAAGFERVEVIEETSFSKFAASMSENDPIVKQAMEALGDDPDRIRRLAASVRSLKVSARKAESRSCCAG